MADNHDDVITAFSEMTNARPEEAARYLSATDWNIETAIAAFFADAEEAGSPPTIQADTAAAAAPAPVQTGPRRLDGQPVQQTASAPAARAARPAPKKKGVATLSSLGGGGAAHAHDDDDDDGKDQDWEDSSRGDLFAGGEKSGLAVKDPSSENSAKKLIDDIVKKAKANSSRPESETPASSSRFRGTARTLGGDGVESRVIPDPLQESEQPRAPANLEPQARTLYLWRDGFSVDDGPLHRFDDPENAADLALIRQGHAPLHLMNVSYDQPVDVKLEQRDENWHQLPRIYRPFGGAGRRLGAPTPGDSSSDPTAAAATAAPAQPAAASAATPPAAISVDESQPVITIRVQLPSGTRLPVRFNTTHTVGDVYGVIRQSSPEMASRQWVVATTFPNKDHTDHGVVLGEMPEFKKGGTAVVKWT